MKQLLKNDSQFAGYTVVRKLSEHHDGEREVYLTKCQAIVDGDIEDVPENHGILTVFDLKSKRYEVDGSARKRVPDFIEEVRFLRSRKPGSNFPRIIDCGIEKTGCKKLGWVMQPNIVANSLTDEIRLQRGLCMADVVKVMEALFNAVEDIARYTRSGGHYNITTDNILVDYDGDNLRDVYLIGLTDIGPFYNGVTPFSNEAADIRFRAPETANNVFGQMSDIYSLGIVMAMMISGETGEDIVDSPAGIDCRTDNNTASLSPAEFRDRFMKQVRGKLSAAQRLILEKATAPNVSGRFLRVETFRKFVSKLSKGRIHTQTHVERTAAVAAASNGSTVTEEEKKLFERLDREAEDKAKTQDRTKKSSPKGLDEVAGMSELKALFRRDFIRIVRNPKVAQAYGIKPSNCTLLYGPQGCGKTFIAEKAAQESGLKYRIVNPSELGSIYIHGSQQKIAELFNEAEKKGPMILIFDEFDAIVPKRDADLNGNQANEVNEMLTQLNNCASRGIYVLATTNRPSLLDPAIMRKGRVDRTVYVSLPDKEARKELFRLEVGKRPCVEMDYEVLASATDNYTCSYISFIVEESSRLCFEETLDRGLDKPLPLSMNRLMEVIKVTQPSVSETQRKEYLELKDKMENRLPVNGRKKVGFVL